MSVTSLRRSPPAVRRTSIDGEPDWSSLAPIAAGLEAALEARAPGIYMGTPLVRKLAAQVSRLLGLDDHERLAIDVCARVRDIGMIGLPDYVIANAGALSASDQALVNRHPAIGASLLQSLPTMAAAAASVRGHHERWDGAGYPDGIRGDAIPLPSRVVAVCDAFVAVATDRPPRRGIGAEGALDFVRRHRGSGFDPNIADCLVAAVTGKGRPATRAPAPAVDRSGEAGSHEAPRAPAAVRDLRSALARFDVVPAFAPACDQALAAPDAPGADGRSALAKAIEGDIGLTVAILRRAQSRGGPAGITNVADAVAMLNRDEIDSTIAALPRASFPWHNGFDALLLRSRLHAQAVARAVERLAHMTKPFDVEDLVAAALLHDIGRLVLARARPDYVAPLTARRTPEQRVREELRELGVDHASLGGLLLERWGLPEELVDAVARHHRSRPESEAAALVRLADMVAHHAQGNAVDCDAMFRLAADWDLPVQALRDIVFDQPPSIVGQRRRTERSPLSTRETEILRLVAEGRRDAEIASELTLSVSTVRTHLHNIHAKLGVAGRAQAVIRASESAWI
ncbi:MAG TPA: HD domain-containing phosphohydrolase [Solirubrobacteraceae bacterium]|nr:HD domain-containing phosphohydrolase [Solirubrobacteraceae bacterium]